MEISVKAKERFCKDCNIPIKVFNEPYFMDRLKLFDNFYGTLEKWDTFTEFLSKYENEQLYFEDYNKVKDSAIEDIKSSEAYQRFNSCDMNQYKVSPVHASLSPKDIFKQSNDGREFISIDMKKANFSALRHYDADIFSGCETWEEFISQYTYNRHIINSKYIRQVILGNCNPKRHVTYEKYIMDQILSELETDCMLLGEVAFFSNDEIVIDVTELEDTVKSVILYKAKSIEKTVGVPLRVELFVLHAICGTEGFYKEIIDKDETRYEFKCLDAYKMPFVLRKAAGEEITESDKVFYQDGLLAKFIEVPEIKNRGLFSLH